MIKLPTREDFERYCKANKERNPWHPEYYSHLPAREQWDVWQAAIAEVQRLNTTAHPVSDGWVKCSDRKPAEPDGEIRIITVMVSNGKSVGFCDYATGCLPSAWGEFSAYGDIDAEEITHWMPLPAAPGGQD